MLVRGHGWVRMLTALVPADKIFCNTFGQWIKSILFVICSFGPTKPCQAINRAVRLYSLLWNKCDGRWFTDTAHLRYVSCKSIFICRCAVKTLHHRLVQNRVWIPSLEKDRIKLYLHAPGFTLKALLLHEHCNFVCLFVCNTVCNTGFFFVRKV